MIFRIILGLILFASVAHGNGGMGPGPGVKAYSGAAPTYELEEDFEGTGTPTGFVVDQGTPDFDATPSVDMQGVKSFSMPGCTGAADIDVSIALNSDTGATGKYFELVVDNFGEASGSGDPLVYFYDNTTVVGFVYLVDNGSDITLMAQSFGGSASTTVSTLSIDTLYKVWVEYLEGTGANATTTVAFSTTGTRPTSGNNYAESTDGTRTNEVNKAIFKVDYSTPTNCWDYFIDDLIISYETIGDNP